jgi:hypothetical protein
LDSNAAGLLLLVGCPVLPAGVLADGTAAPLVVVLLLWLLSLLL